MEQSSQIWNALNTGFRLSVSYSLRAAVIDSGQGVSEAKRVTEALTAVGILGEEKID